VVLDQVLNLSSNFFPLAIGTERALWKYVFADVFGCCPVSIAILPISLFAQSLIINPGDNVYTGFDQAISHSTRAAEKVNRYSSCHRDLKFPYR
jgi:hypothetical protein